MFRGRAAPSVGVGVVEVGVGGELGKFGGGVGAGDGIVGNLRRDVAEGAKEFGGCLFRRSG